MPTPLVNWLKREIRNGNTPILVFCGRARSGKTAFAMETAYEVYPKKFKYEYVVSDIESFVKLYAALDNCIIILDEASDSLYVYDWNSLFQKIFSVINDSQAYKHNIVFLILPMVHKLGKMHRYDVDALVMTRKIKNFDTNKQEVYYRYKIHLKNYDDLTMRPPRTMTILDWCGPVPLPPDHLWLPYINKGQKEFKEKILERNLNQMFKKLNPRKQAQVHLNAKPQNRSPAE